METLFDFVQKHAVLLAGALGIFAALGVGTRSLYKRKSSKEAAGADDSASERPLDDQKLRKTNLGTHGSGSGSDE